MEKRSFSDFIEDKQSHIMANACKLKMPKTKAEVDEVMDTILKIAEDNNVETGNMDVEGIKKALVRKVEIENDPDFLREVFHAASAMYSTFIQSDGNMKNMSASNFAHVLTMTLTAMEEKGAIKINVKKLK